VRGRQAVHAHRVADRGGPSSGSCRRSRSRSTPTCRRRPASRRPRATSGRCVRVAVYSAHMTVAPTALTDLTSIVTKTAWASPRGHSWRCAAGRRRAGQRTPMPRLGQRHVHDLEQRGRDNDHDALRPPFGRTKRPQCRSESASSTSAMAAAPPPPPRNAEPLAEEDDAQQRRRERLEQRRHACRRRRDVPESPSCRAHTRPPSSPRRGREARPSQCQLASGARRGSAGAVTPRRRERERASVSGAVERPRPSKHDVKRVSES